MPKVVVTYYAWDHNEKVIPAELKPRIRFKPLSTSFANGLLTNREVWGTLDPETGAGRVELESDPEIEYVPVMDWLVDPSQELEMVENRARGECEWRAFSPGKGGDISDLPGLRPFAGVYFGFGDPPAELRARDDVLYMDISGAPSGGVEWWGPEGSFVGGGA